MSNTATLAIQMLEIIAILISVLFVYLQIGFKREEFLIRHEIFHSALIGMLFLLVASVTVTLLIFREGYPNLGFAAGMINALFLYLFFDALLFKYWN